MSASEPLLPDLSATATAPPAPSAASPVIDVTDATFQRDVLDRSVQTPVVVDLWAPWCGPCRQLGPVLEKVVGSTAGQAVLAKVNVDENPQISQAFRVQGIPAVFGIANGQVVSNFVGAQGEPAVQAFVDALLPTDEQREVDALLAAGDEASLEKVLELEPANERAIIALAEVKVGTGDRASALALLDRVPETTEARRVAALARAGEEALQNVEPRLDALLDRVKDDPDARQEFLDLLELLGPADARTVTYRRALTTRLY